MSIIYKMSPVIHILKIYCSFAIICHILSQCSRLSAVTSACATLFTFLDILADSEELLSGEVAVSSHLEEISLVKCSCSPRTVQGYTAVLGSLSAPYMSSTSVDVIH